MRASTAPTAITLAKRRGTRRRPRRRCPAAATTTTPAATARSIARLHRLAEALAAQAQVDDLDRVRPALRVVRWRSRCPRPRRRRCPRRRVQDLDRHDARSRRRARPRPVPLFVASAIVEATWVPWYSSSFAWASPFTKSKPGRNRCLPQSGALRKAAPCSGRCSPRRRRRCRGPPPRPRACPSGSPRSARRRSA